jgi:hypothetical protein
MNEPWTPEDDERLRKLAAEGRSSLTISERMKRPPQSIRDRAKKLKISLRILKAGRSARVELAHRGPTQRDQG